MLSKASVADVRDGKKPEGADDVDKDGQRNQCRFDISIGDRRLTHPLG